MRKILHMPDNKFEFNHTLYLLQTLVQYYSHQKKLDPQPAVQLGGIRCYYPISDNTMDISTTQQQNGKNKPTASISNESTRVNE